MVWMGSDENDGNIPIAFDDDEPQMTQLGNSDMANFNINNDAERLINQHPDMQQQLGAMPNLPAPRNIPMGLIANKKESMMLLGIGALIGFGIVRIWDHRTK